MTLQLFIQDYGYAAVLVGTFLEGDMVLVLGGFTAHLGYLKLPGVVLAAAISTFVRVSIFFFLGRYSPPVSRFALLNRARVVAVHRLVERYHLAVILAFRFFYGLGIITPIMLGMSRVPTAQFMILNSVGAMLWAAVIGLCGYAFGTAMRSVFGTIKRYELVALAALGVVVIALWLLRRRRAARRQEKVHELRS
jgi:membrane protein DedA with SNARE-associated domain